MILPTRLNSDLCWAPAIEEPTAITCLSPSFFTYVSSTSGKLPIDIDNFSFILHYIMQVDQSSLTMYSTLVRFRLPSLDQISAVDVAVEESPAFYICSLEKSYGNKRWIHQGTEPGVKLRTYQRALPLWIQVVICAFLLTLSGLFSGLNLGTSLDVTNLFLDSKLITSRRLDGFGSDGIENLREHWVGKGETLCKCHYSCEKSWQLSVVYSVIGKCACQLYTHDSPGRFDIWNHCSDRFNYRNRHLW